MAGLSVCRWRSVASCSSTKGLVLGVLVRILLAVVQLLLESLGFLLIRERQCSKAVFKLEGVEEDTILVVCKGVVDLLIPYDATIGRRYVDQLQPECVAHQIIRQDYGALKTRIVPSVLVRVGYVQLRDSNGMDLVR